jgi:hypothetical protein
MQFHFLSFSYDIIVRFILVFAFSFNINGYFPCCRKARSSTILVPNSGVVQMIENVFYAMFAFWQGSLHVFKDVSYVKKQHCLKFYLSNS